MGESARMHSNPRRVILLLAALAALVLAATAWADTGSDPTGSGTQTTPHNGGTAARDTPPVQASGGVAGPVEKRRAQSAQTTTPTEEPPQVETTPTETTPSNGNTQTPSTPTNTTTGEQTGAAPTASSGSSGGGGGFLPHTGLEIGALAAVGLGLLLAGLAMRRRPHDFAG
jgi:hypothetical protein